MRLAMFSVLGVWQVMESSLRILRHRYYSHLHFTGGDWDTAKLNNLLKVIQKAGGGLEFQPWQ